MRKNTKKNKKGKKAIIIIIVTIFVLLIIAGTFSAKFYLEKTEEEKKIKLESTIKEHYSLFVKTNKEAKIYIYNNDSYTEAGSISEDEIIALEEQNISYETKYFKIKELDQEYYIEYQDVLPAEEEKTIDNRYKKYIPFNENIITDDDVNFYDAENNLIYNIKASKTLPILIKYGDYYGIEYNNRLLKVKKEDVQETIENKNTELKNTSGIAVLNYHFFYDEKEESERKDCNQIICHSKSLYESHLKYITENNIFTPTMEEFELYLDKKINLPKSVLITIDDGWRMFIGLDLMEQYKVNGTVFLITSWFKEIKYFDEYEYVEFHSHGDNLHTQGACPGGQGGAIKCVAKDKLLADLALSRQKLRGSTVFCYPFYEYNSYSIEVLKEAGFTMSFAGGFRRAKPGDNKYALPRYVMYNNTTVNSLKKYIG